MSAPITLNGRLTADPEIRFSPSGTAVAKFTIVTSRRVKDQNTGEWSDADVTFWDCVAFKQLAEGIADSLQKGLEIVASGRAVQENWTDKQTGAKRSKISVRVDSIGPNLARVTARVTKNQPGGSGAGQQHGARQSDQWSTGQPSQGGWGGQQTRPSSSEPPF